MVRPPERRTEIAVGIHLKKLREARGWTLRDVQEKTGISSGHLSLIENGQVKNPSPSVLNRLAGAFEIAPDSLLVLAGYLESKGPKARKSALEGVALSALKDLDEDEISQVTAFVQVLRQRKGRPAR
jgi:HTH-type transcriptional regulator, competence development regulator